MNILGFGSDAERWGGDLASIVIIVAMLIQIRRAKKNGAPPPSTSELKKRFSRLAIMFIAAFMVSPVILWPALSHLPQTAVVIFAIADLGFFLLILAFLYWMYKKACRNSGDLE